MKYLLDTNIILAYIRADRTSKAIERKFGLMQTTTGIPISIISVGEIKAIAKKNQWGKKKVGKMLDLLNDLIIIDINTDAITERYAEIDAFSQAKLAEKPTSFSARNMGKNDLWIAATAAVYELELVTTDKDFKHLKDEYLQLKTIDLSQF